MANQLFKFPALIIIALMTFNSCNNKDEGPTVIPTSEFSIDRRIVEVNDIVTFTNSSQDATSYLWNFGDGHTSTEENPTHFYDYKNSYTVTLTTTSSSGDTSESKSLIKVGSRIMVGLTVHSLNHEQKSDGTNWDEDGSGPEVYLAFNKFGEVNNLYLHVGDNLTSNDLPFEGVLSSEFIRELTNEDWHLFAYDKDAPLSINTSDLMLSLRLNPTRISSEKNYDTGEGSFHVTFLSVIIEVAFQVR